MRLLALCMGLLFSLWAQAEKGFQDHAGSKKRPEIAPSKAAPEVRVCIIRKFEIPKEKKNAPICKNTKLGKEIPLNKISLKEVVGQTFVTGDPCDKVENLDNEPPPPASPEAILDGIAEVLQLACLDEFSKEDDKAELKDITVNKAILQELDYTRAYYPMVCHPRKVHSEK